MKVLVGLGNPGAQYAKTRHNVGFMALDRTAEKLNASFTREKFGGLTAEVRFANENVILLKPQTYMNRSGESVSQALRYSEADPSSDLLIIYDEADLPLGALRIRKEGSAGSHNGMKSVLSCLGGTNVPRLRIGVGASKHGGALTGHVLGKFTAEEWPVVDEVVEHAADAALCFVREGVERAMNRFNASAVKNGSPGRPKNET